MRNIHHTQTPKVPRDILDQTHGRVGTPIFTTGFEPLARVAPYLAFKNNCTRLLSQRRLPLHLRTLILQNFNGTNAQHLRGRGRLLARVTRSTAKVCPSTVAWVDDKKANYGRGSASLEVRRSSKGEAFLILSNDI